MQTKPTEMPQYIYDWTNAHNETLKSLYNDFCLEMGNKKIKFLDFCHFMYFECRH